MTLRELVIKLLDLATQNNMLNETMDIKVGHEILRVVNIRVEEGKVVMELESLNERF